MQELKGKLQEKNGMYYCVISYKLDGKWKMKWKTTKVLAKQGNRKKAKDTFPQIVADFQKELEEKELHQKMEENSYEKRIEENKNKTFTAFVKESIEEFSVRVEETTYYHWLDMCNRRIYNYFGVYNNLDKITNEDVERPKYYEKELKISEINQFEIEDFYKWLYACNLKGSSVAKYHVLLNLIFKRAIRLKIFSLETNPMKDISKPIIEPYTAEIYTSQELNILFEIVKGEKIEMPVILASFYALRRSEVLGLKFSAVDFENKLITIKHTVTMVKGFGEEQEIHSKEYTKNNDIRILPLIPYVEQKLLEHKQKIEENKKLYGKDYVKNTDDYICVDNNGELLKPGYITSAFSRILRKNKDKLNKKIKFHRFKT